VGTETRLVRVELMETTEISGVLPANFPAGVTEFLKMLSQQAVCAMFQPIVSCPDESVFGYEILGRGAFEHCAKEPEELFRIAGSIGLEAELSRLFCVRGIAEGIGLPGEGGLFVNVHPTEVKEPDFLLKSMDETRAAYPDAALTLELHETLVTDKEAIRSLKSRLSDLRIRIAYDDFGAGRARLIELADVPPDYLKFDRRLIKELHAAQPNRQQMVGMLVDFAHDIGVQCIAEGVETAAEAKACRNLGFDLAQGFYYAVPLTLQELTPADP
jgi:EAL domain-containing protein (putative c-di-GMP-specific phosphodiesterase class I)